MLLVEFLHQGMNGFPVVWIECEIFTQHLFHRHF